MELGNHTLEEWLVTPPAELLKLGGDTFPFSSKYIAFKNYLDNHLHKEVTKSAVLREFREGKNIDAVIYLNDHGPDHIKTVIERASQLLNNGVACELNPREVFLLLNAIQVHDVGNFYGRYGHEAKVLQAIGEGLTPILFDIIEANYIKDIAQVHGGKITYKDGREDKNTISKIKTEVTSDGYTIRKQLLASILRFADELADDKYRADSKTLEDGGMPRGSEIFHAYAACLDTVKVVHEKHAVELHFKIPKKYLTRTFGKIQKDGSIKEQYLLDEIFDRSLKMHAERMYCAKFWKKYIDIDKIWVQIEFYANVESDEQIEEGELFVHSDITFTLDDQEYPAAIPSIHLICKELNPQGGKELNGKNLRESIEGKLKSPKTVKTVKKTTQKAEAKKKPKGIKKGNKKKSLNQNSKRKK